FFLFQQHAATTIYSLSLHDALPICNAMTMSAGYLPVGDTREPGQYTPEASRRARGVEIWAALKSLGRSGLAEMVEHHCRLATHLDRKSTRLNSSHVAISYAVFCLKK